MKRKQKKTFCTAATAGIISLLLLTSCAGFPETNRGSVVFPDFPSPETDGETVVCFDGESGTVTMPLWYWLAVVEYAVEVDGAEKMYRAECGEGG